MIYALLAITTSFSQPDGGSYRARSRGSTHFSSGAAAAGKADYSQEIEGITCPDDPDPEDYPHRAVSGIHLRDEHALHRACRPGGGQYYNAPGARVFRATPWARAHRLKVWERQHRIILEKSPTFRKDYYPTSGAPGDREKGLLDDAGKRLPFLDEVWFTIICGPARGGSSFSRVTSMRRHTPGTVRQDDHEEPELSNAFVKKGISLEISSNLETSYIAFNMRDPILGRNKYLRQALSLAYDSDLYNDIYLNGRAINAQGPCLPASSVMTLPQEPLQNAHLTKARELLAKAGYPGGVDARTGKRLDSPTT